MSPLTAQSHPGPLSQSDEQQPAGYMAAHLDTHCKGTLGLREKAGPT